MIKTSRLQSLKMLTKLNSWSVYLIGLFLIVCLGGYFLLTAQAVPTGGILTVTLDSSSPDKDILVASSANNTVAAFKLQADGFEDLDLDEFTVTNPGPDTVPFSWDLYVDDVFKATLYQIAGKFSYTPPDDTVIIPAGGQVIITLKVNVNNTGIFTNGDTLQATLNANADVKYTGKTTLGSFTAAGSFPVNADAHVAYDGRPSVSLNAGSPAGFYAPASDLELAIFNVWAVGDDISFIGSDGNSLTIKIDAGCQWPVIQTSTLTLKDYTGAITYDVISGINLCDSGIYTFDFTNNDLWVIENSLERLVVEGDTTYLPSGSDTPIRVSLLDDSPPNINWSISGDAGNYQEADIIFKGDIYGNILVIDGIGDIIRPYVSVNAGTPSGLYSPDANLLLAIFDISATGDDITFDSSAGNSLTVNVQSLCTGAGAPGNFVLKDITDTITYDVISGVNLCNDGAYTFDFTDNNLVIPSAGTNALVFWGDTSSFGMDYVLRLWLDDDIPTNIGWSVDLDGSNWQNASLVFTGDIYGNNLVFDGPVIPDTVLPQIAITAPTKTSDKVITDTTIQITDNYSISAASVSLVNSTLNYGGLNCVQTTGIQVDCTLSINSSGDLVVDVTDNATNPAQATEAGYSVNIPASASKREILSQPAPTCELSVNNGDTETTSLDTELLLTTNVPIGEMLISNDADFLGATWTQYSMNTSWQLTNDTYGTKTVYAMVKDGLGRLSPVCSDAIEYVEEVVVPEEEEEVDNFLVKAPDSSTIYFVDAEMKRHPFPDATTFFSWFSDFEEVIVLPMDMLEIIPLASNVTIRQGTWLVKLTTDPKVYAVEQIGVLRWIETEDVAQGLYGNDWASRVIDISDPLFPDYQLGDSIVMLSHPDGAVIQYQGQTTKFYIEGTQKRLISSEVFMSNYFQDKFVITGVSTSISYEEGVDLPEFKVDIIMTLR